MTNDIERRLSLLESQLKHRLLHNDTSNIRRVQDPIVELHIDMPVLRSMTWTNNSPGAGQASWTKGDLVYLGSIYHILASNTGNKYIWWTIGNNTFTSGAVYTSSRNDFLIAINRAGIVDTAWNKLALPT